MNINLTLFGQMVTFAFFVWFCMKFVWPIIIEAMEERQKKIADGLDAADRALRDLELAQIVGSLEKPCVIDEFHFREVGASMVAGPLTPWAPQQLLYYSSRRRNSLLYESLWGACGVVISSLVNLS